MNGHKSGMKLQGIAVATRIAFVAACGMAVHYCFRHHVISYPIKERVDVVVSRGGRSYSAHVNVLSSFSTGFPDSTGSLKAHDWPLQFHVPDGNVLYASMGGLLMAPDHYAERTHPMDSGVERRDYAIKHYTGKSLDLCVEPNRLPQYHEAYLNCPTFFTLAKPGNLNSIKVVSGPDTERRLENGWRVVSVKITMNEEPIFEPDVSELPALPRDHDLASRTIAGKLDQKRICSSWAPGQNPFCKDFENGSGKQDNQKVITS